MNVEYVFFAHCIVACVATATTVVVIVVVAATTVKAKKSTETIVKSIKPQRSQ